MSQHFNYKNEAKLISDIGNLDKLICNSVTNERIEILRQELNIKKNELNALTENKIEGYIVRSKAQVVEEGEKISKYFADLEKKRAE